MKTALSDDKTARVLVEPAPKENSAAPAELLAVPDGKTTKFFSGLWSHKWLFAVAVLGLSAVSYASIRYFRGVVVPVELVQRADLLETVVASGHVESPYRVEIASQITGTVVSVAVREGEMVRQGQPLIMLSADELQNTAAQAQAAVAQAEANVRQIGELSLPQASEARRSAQASLIATQQIFNRTSALMAQGFVTRAYFDEVTKNRDVARTQVAIAEAQIRSS